MFYEIYHPMKMKQPWDILYNDPKMKHPLWGVLQNNPKHISQNHSTLNKHPGVFIKSPPKWNPKDVAWNPWTKGHMEEYFMTPPLQWNNPGIFSWHPLKSNTQRSVLQDHS